MGKKNTSAMVGVLTGATTIVTGATNVFGFVQNDLAQGLMVGLGGIVLVGSLVPGVLKAIGL